MQTKVLIVGAGAIGAFYGALLAKAGANVAVVCRSDYEVVKSQGYQINSDVLGQWGFHPEQIVTRAKEYQGQADYVILCSKITPDVNRAELIKDALHAGTSIVLIQNGIEVEQELASAFPGNELISGLAFICSNRTAPGVIHHLAYGKLTLGNFPHGCSEKTRHLINLFAQSGIECIGMDDIVTGRWIKCVWNAPFNPLSVLAGGLPTKAILDTQEPLIRGIMQEVCQIAAACGHPLPDDIIDININNTHAMPPYKTSMLLDFERGNVMETEVILGNSLRAAERESVDVPRIKTLYALMKLKELSNQNSRGMTM